MSYRSPSINSLYMNTFPGVAWGVGWGVATYRTSDYRRGVRGVGSGVGSGVANAREARVSTRESGVAFGGVAFHDLS